MCWYIIGWKIIKGKEEKILCEIIKTSLFNIGLNGELFALHVERSYLFIILKIIKGPNVFTL